MRAPRRLSVQAPGAAPALECAFAHPLARRVRTLSGGADTLFWRYCEGSRPHTFQLLQSSRSPTPFHGQTDRDDVGAGAGVRKEFRRYLGRICAFEGGVINEHMAIAEVERSRLAQLVSAAQT